MYRNRQQSQDLNRNTSKQHHIHLFLPVVIVCIIFLKKKHLAIRIFVKQKVLKYEND